jgi:hypothetical protein
MFPEVDWDPPATRAKIVVCAFDDREGYEKVLTVFRVATPKILFDVVQSSVRLGHLGNLRSLGSLGSLGRRREVIALVNYLHEFVFRAFEVFKPPGVNAKCQTAPTEHLFLDHHVVMNLQDHRYDRVTWVSLEPFEVIPIILLGPPHLVHTVRHHD